MQERLMMEEATMSGKTVYEAATHLSLPAFKGLCLTGTRFTVDKDGNVSTRLGEFKRDTLFDKLVEGGYLKLVEGDAADKPEVLVQNKKRDIEEPRRKYDVIQDSSRTSEIKRRVKENCKAKAEADRKERKSRGMQVVESKALTIQHGGTEKPVQEKQVSKDGKMPVVKTVTSKIKTSKDKSKRLVLSREVDGGIAAIS